MCSKYFPIIMYHTMLQNIPLTLSLSPFLAIFAKINFNKTIEGQVEADSKDRKSKQSLTRCLIKAA